MKAKVTLALLACGVLAALGQTGILIEDDTSFRGVATNLSQAMKCVGWYSNPSGGGSAFNWGLSNGIIVTLTARHVEHPDTPIRTNRLGYIEDFYPIDTHFIAADGNTETTPYLKACTDCLTLERKFG